MTEAVKKIVIASNPLEEIQDCVKVIKQEKDYYSHCGNSPYTSRVEESYWLRLVGLLDYICDTDIKGKSNADILDDIRYAISHLEDAINAIN